ncbi:UNVERIFIED_CONTAM: hypothetical protein HDU68_009445 [Siphonaria sp. JEL0065]|nr:hypothetical protein HDU68_009445 [Siphonaria sp. JEL0065]
MNRFSRRSEPVKGEVTIPNVKFIPATNQESQYLQSSIGRVLVAGITQILASRCEDPVDALGRFLIKYDENRITFEREERERLEHQAKVKAQPTRQQLDEMRTRFEDEKKKWTLDNSVSNDALFRAPTPHLPKAIPEEKKEEEVIQVDTVDPALVLPEEGSGISAIDNAIHGSQELRNSSEEGATIADLEQDAIIPTEAKEDDDEDDEPEDDDEQEQASAPAVEQEQSEES